VARTSGWISISVSNAAISPVAAPYASPCRWRDGWLRVMRWIAGERPARPLEHHAWRYTRPMPLRPLFKLALHLLLALSLAMPAAGSLHLFAASAAADASDTAGDHGQGCGERSDATAPETAVPTDEHGGCCDGCIGGVCDMAACLSMAWVPKGVVLPALAPVHTDFLARLATPVPRWAERLFRPPIG
jgi:hypothetical protein